MDGGAIVTVSGKLHYNEQEIVTIYSSYIVQEHAGSLLVKPYISTSLVWLQQGTFSHVSTKQSSC